MYSDDGKQKDNWRYKYDKKGNTLLVNYRQFRVLDLKAKDDFAVIPEVVIPAFDSFAETEVKDNGVNLEAARNVIVNLDGTLAERAMIRSAIDNTPAGERDANDERIFASISELMPK